jgi:hypothetical protein
LLSNFNLHRYVMGRVFGILREKNPALSEKTKTIIKPPQVLREGTKKTVFVNLMEICNAMHRNHDHVIQYLMAELGTSGTLVGLYKLANPVDPYSLKGAWFQPLSLSSGKPVLKFAFPIQLVPLHPGRAEAPYPQGPLPSQGF